MVMYYHQLQPTQHLKTVSPETRAVWTKEGKTSTAHTLDFKLSVVLRVQKYSFYDKGPETRN